LLQPLRTVLARPEMIYGAGHAAIRPTRSRISFKPLSISTISAMYRYVLLCDMIFDKLTVAIVVICLDIERCASCCPDRDRSGILSGLETHETQGKDGERYHAKPNTFLIPVFGASHR